MSSPEFTSWHDGDYEFTQAFAAHVALQNVRRYYNQEDALITENTEEPLPWEPGQELGLKTTFPCNNLEIVVNNRTRGIGYFNPGGSEYTFYSDFIDPMDVPVLQDLASLQRQEAFFDFLNSKGPRKWVDYSHPDVRELHETLNAAIMGTGIIWKIIDHHNFEVPKLPVADRFDLDKDSAAAVCLSNANISGTAVADYFLGLRLFGALKYGSNRKTLLPRDAVKVINLGKLADPRDLNSGYVPVEHSGDPLTPPDILDELAELAEEIKRVRSQVDGFNAECLGVEFKSDEVPVLV